MQPVFSLMHASLLESLVRATAAGRRKIDRWARQHRFATVSFDDADAFFNASTLAELQGLQGPPARADSAPIDPAAPASDLTQIKALGT